MRKNTTAALRAAVAFCELVRVAGTEKDEAILGIPLVVGMPVVRVKPEIVVVPIDVEDVRVAVRVRYVRDAIRVSTPRRPVSILGL